MITLKKKSQELLDSLEKEEPAEKTKTAPKEERKRSVKKGKKESLSTAPKGPGK